MNVWERQSNYWVRFAILKSMGEDTEGHDHIDVVAEAEVEPPIPIVEKTRAEEVAELSDAKLVGALLDQLDLALDTYDAHIPGFGIGDDEKEALAEIIGDLRSSFDIPEGFLQGGRIKITHKLAKVQDDPRLDRGEDVGVNVEVHLPKLGKLVVLNIYGSRQDYEGSEMLHSGQASLADNIIDTPRTVNFHLYKEVPSHGNAKNMRLMHDARYRFFRSGHPGNRIEVMRHDGANIEHDARPIFAIDSRISQKMNGELFALTDQFYNRRDPLETDG